MSQNSIWKYLFIIVVALVGLFYAYPNIYRDDFAVQVSASRGGELNAADLEQVEQTVIASGFSPVATHLESGSVIVRFKTPDEQLKARDFLLGKFPQHSVALNLYSSAPKWLSKFGAKPMALGLDLSGGIHLLFEVDVEATIAQRIEQTVTEVRNLIRRQRLGRPEIKSTATEINLLFADKEERDATAKLLRKEFKEMVIAESGADQRFKISLAFSEVERTTIQDNAIRQNVATLRTRVDALGVSEPIVQRQGRNRILVELPGIQDSNRVMDILGAVATLEFRMVDQQNDANRAFQTGIIPAQSNLHTDRHGQPVLLQRQVMLTGEYITDARFNFDQQANSPIVSIRLNNKGGQIFYDATRENIGKLMGILFIDSKLVTREIDGEMVRVREKSEKVISVATIRDALRNNFQISGLDSPAEARDLALLLRAGSLAAPLNLAEERTIGPSMGKDNIEKGKLAVVVGLVLVLIFMGLYYRMFGLFANVSLILNVVLIVAALSLFQATLTLPGIAGIILTVGMAVDINVIIFERIREELSNGMSPLAAINSGYEQAFSTVMDANITTLIAAIVLFVFGTGPIKGFAVTLTIGIIASMFCGIVVTRALSSFFLRKRKLTSLSI